MSAASHAAERTKTVTWHDPAAAAAQAAGLTGRELLQGIVDGRLPPPPMANLVGARLVSVGDGEALFRCTPDGSAYNPLGMVHGGLLCTLLDFAVGCAVHSRLPAGVGFSSIEIKVSFLKSIRAGVGEIEVHGQALRVGQRVAFAEAHARNGDGELVGHATSSIALLR
ncbi:MAG TPA: PaaI family thioesterase [Solirubrobacteraceae bacterium]